MAVKIRLRRVGAKKQPAYRIVVADSRAPRDGRFIEIIGHYNPLTEPSTVVVNAERALHWLRTGAQATDVVQKMLVKKGIIAVFKGEATELPMEEVPSVPVVVAPVVEAPVVEAPVVEAPVVEEPVVEEPVIEEPAVEAPAVEEPSAPASDEITAE